MEVNCANATARCGVEQVFTVTRWEGEKKITLILYQFGSRQWRPFILRTLLNAAMLLSYGAWLSQKKAVWGRRLVWLLIAGNSTFFWCFFVLHWDSCCARRTETLGWQACPWFNWHLPNRVHVCEIAQRLASEGRDNNYNEEAYCSPQGERSIRTQNVDWRASCFAWISHASLWMFV